MRNFRIFWASQTLSVAGDAFSLIAVPLLVLHSTGSVAKMGLLTALAAAGNLLTGFFAGAIVDRFDRRRLLITADVARFVLYGSIPVAWLLAGDGAKPLWLLYLVAPLAAGFGMLFQVGYVTAVAGLVGPDKITEANGKLFASHAAAGIGGTLCAGLVSGAFGASVAIAADAATFAVSALGLLLVRLRKLDGVPGKVSAWKGFAVGAGFLWRHPVLRSLTLLLVVFHFFYLGITDIIIYYVRNVLGHPDRTVGYVMAMAAVGTVAGSLAVGPLRRRFGFGVCWIMPTFLLGVAVAGIGLTTTVAVIAMLALACICFASISGICSMSLRQQITPDHLLGRVTSAYWTVQQSLAPIGAAVLTAATARSGVTQVLLVSGSILAAVGLTGAFTPVRQPHPERLGMDPA